jgi:hypothetical protein
VLTAMSETQETGKKNDRNSNDGQSDLETNGHNKRRRQEAVGDAKRPRGRQEVGGQAAASREGCVACTEIPHGACMRWEGLTTAGLSSGPLLLIDNIFCIFMYFRCV